VAAALPELVAQVERVVRAAPLAERQEQALALAEWGVARAAMRGMARERVQAGVEVVRVAAAAALEVELAAVAGVEEEGADNSSAPNACTHLIVGGSLLRMNAW
jgi:hypothetical protein